MKISTKGRYALEAVLDLALHSLDSHESIKNIADRTNISLNYLEQIFVVLRRKGILESIRGSQGGYRLSGTPESITAGAVIRALEGPFSPVECIGGKKENFNCEMYDDCATRGFWHHIMDVLDEVADSVTIADLMEGYRNTMPTVQTEYFI